MQQRNIDGYVRITKHAARARHRAGLACYILPHKMRPGNMWEVPFKISGDDPEDRTFDQIANAYEYYNCNYELGYYVAFYKRVEG